MQGVSEDEEESILLLSPLEGLVDWKLEAGVWSATLMQEPPCNTDTEAQWLQPPNPLRQEAQSPCNTDCVVCGTEALFPDAPWIQPLNPLTFEDNHALESPRNIEASLWTTEQVQCLEQDIPQQSCGATQGTRVEEALPVLLARLRGVTNTRKTPR